MIYKVYKITHTPTGKVYIGRTRCALGKRFSWHFSNARNSSGNSDFVVALRRYPRSDFAIEVLEETDSNDDSFVVEAKYIDLYDSINTGFNMKECDRVPWNKGKKMSEEYCNRLRGERNPMHGRTHTDEYKAWRRKLMSTIQNGADNRMAKSVRCIELDRTWQCIADCARELGVNGECITRVCKGRNKVCGGYHFEYV